MMRRRETDVGVGALLPHSSPLAPTARCGETTSAAAAVAAHCPPAGALPPHIRCQQQQR